MSPLVHVVILNWNNAADTLACIASVEAQRYPNYRIVVVDNGSSEAEIAPLRHAGSRFHLLMNPYNMGFAGGCNTGMRYSLTHGAKYIWLLNSDATVESETLEQLVATAEADQSIGLVSPVLRNTEAAYGLEPFCAFFDPAGLTYEHTNEIVTARAWQSARPGNVALMGTALLIRCQLIKAIGMLDENFFAYWEDTDYSIRSNAAGFVNRVDFDATVFHPSKDLYVTPGSVGRHYYYYMTRNEIILLRKHGAGLRSAKAIRWAFLRQMRMIARLSNNDAAVQAVLAGIWDGWIGHGGSFRITRRMPWPLRYLLSTHPGFADLIAGNWRSRAV